MDNSSSVTNSVNSASLPGAVPGLFFYGDLINIAPESEFKDKSSGEITTGSQKLQVAFKDAKGKMKFFDIGDKHKKFSAKDEGKKNLLIPISIGENNGRIWYAVSQ